MRTFCVPYKMDLREILFPVVVSMNSDMLSFAAMFLPRYSKSLSYSPTSTVGKVLSPTKFANLDSFSLIQQKNVQSIKGRVADVGTE
mmetsp:Transcript_10136/g.16603  ORF Transcript_10136/g.16603 Transcript_10136/m.16603 type:complete len:87 (-) Transcript_10136:1398-1658(-)